MPERLNISATSSVLVGDCLEALRSIEPGTVQTTVTSPPYFQQRDYGMSEQLGLERTPEAFIESLVEVFRGVYQATSPTGTLWLNMGDTYNAYNGNRGASRSFSGVADRSRPKLPSGMGLTDPSLKNKDLIGIPWRTAQALQAPFHSGRVKDASTRLALAAVIDALGTFDVSASEPTLAVGVGGDLGAKLLTDHFPEFMVEHGRLVVRGPALGEVISTVFPHLVRQRTSAMLIWNAQRLLDGGLALSEPRDAKRLDQLVAALTGRRGTPTWAREPEKLDQPGWVLRSEIIWHKPNGAPERTKDRPARSHEHIFLFSKRDRYFFDRAALSDLTDGVTTERGGFRVNYRRTVWSVLTRPYESEHQATYPPELVEPCVLSGTAPGDLVLDPFSGSGTTGAVALQHGRRYVGIELNPDYAAYSQERLAAIA